MELRANKDKDEAADGATDDLEALVEQMVQREARRTAALRQTGACFCSERRASVLGCDVVVSGWRSRCASARPMRCTRVCGDCFVG